jgi:hypothetical protein
MGYQTLSIKAAPIFFSPRCTALSRAYYNHRYSGDFDFFVNANLSYDEQMDKIFVSLQGSSFFWDKARDFIRSDSYISFKVGWKKSEILLKLDFVNDTVPHF